MKALNNIKFPRLSSVSRGEAERQYDETNQFRMNQNFKIIQDELLEHSESLEKLPKSILAELNRAQDTITELSKNGIWTIRKWESGAVDAFGTTLSISKNISTQCGSLYSETETISFPTGIFVSDLCVDCSVCAANAVVFASVSAASTSALTVQIIAPSSGLVDFTFQSSHPGDGKIEVI